MACVVGALLLGRAASLQAQECLTFRTEKCAKKAGIKAWGGSGRDPLRRRTEPQALAPPPVAPLPEPPSPPVVVPTPAPLAETAVVVPAPLPVVKPPQPEVKPTPGPPPSAGSDGVAARPVLFKAEAASAPTPTVGRPPIYKRWWFWTAVGGVVAGAAVAGALAATKPWELPPPPEVHDLRGKL